MAIRRSASDRDATRPLVHGVYIMPPFRRYDLAAEVIAVLREETVSFS